MIENNELPQSWEYVKLGEIVEEVVKVQPKDKPDEEFIYLDISSIDNSQYKIVSPKQYLGIEAPSRARQLVKSGDILFSTVRTYLKNIAQVQPTYDGQIASTGFCVIRPASPLNKPYYFYLTLTDQFINPLSKIQRGTSYPAVRNSDVLEQYVPLPPLPEQHRIVAKIEELFTQLDAGLAELKQAKAQLKRYRQSVLKAAVEGELTREWRETRGTGEASATQVVGDRKVNEADASPQLPELILSERRAKWEAEELAKMRAKGQEPKDDKWKAKYKEPTQPVADDLPESPKGWVWATLEQLSWNASYGTSQKCNYDADGPPVIRIPNISNGRLNFDDLKYATKPDELSDNKAIASHDLLIIRTNGSIDLIGRSALVRNEPETPYYFASYLIRYRLLPTSNSSPWVALIWDSHFVRNWMIIKAATTAGQYNVSVSKLNRLVIPLPPADEQEKIIAMAERRLAVADEIEKEIDQALVRAEHLRQSILKRAFEGKLVEQDPDDEPASVLLDD